MEPHQVCSLRGHLNSITCTEPYDRDNEISLISADANGWIIWWDINTRRPYCVWKGHDSNIVTIRQIRDGLLLTHSKDSDIKIWDIVNFTKASQKMPDEKYNEVNFFNFNESEKEENRRLTDELLGKFPWPENVVIPVNALNYCNVAYFNDYLITPATTDSNNFDIYLIFTPTVHEKKSLESKLNLKRVVTNMDPLSLYKKTMMKANKQIGIEFEIGHDDNEILKRDGFGIMMRILVVRSNLFYIGYESGHLIGFHIDFSGSRTIPEKLMINENYNEQGSPQTSGLSGLGQKSKVFDKTIINREPKITIIYINNTCSPNPILSLEFDKYSNKIICGSTGKRLTVHDIPGSFESMNTHYESADYNLRHSGIQSLTLNSDLIVVGFWDGLIKGLDHNLEQVFKYNRKLPRIGILESNSGQAQQSEQPNNVKLSTVKLIEPSHTTTINLKDYKSLIKTKRSISNRKLLIASYDDGTITIFKL